MSVETTVRLSKIPNIVSIKDASGNLDAMAEIISKTPDDFTVYSGDDSFNIAIVIDWRYRSYFSCFPYYWE